MIPVLEESQPEAIERLGVLGALETRVTGEEKFELFSGLPALFRGFRRRVRGFRRGVRVCRGRVQGFRGFRQLWSHDERVGMRRRRVTTGGRVEALKCESKPL